MICVKEDSWEKLFKEKWGFCHTNQFQIERMNKN